MEAGLKQHYHLSLVVYNPDVVKYRYQQFHRFMTGCDLTGPDKALLLRYLPTDQKHRRHAILMYQSRWMHAMSCEIAGKDSQEAGRVAANRWFLSMYSRL